MLDDDRHLSDMAMRYASMAIPARNNTTRVGPTHHSDSLLLGWGVKLSSRRTALLSPVSRRTTRCTDPPAHHAHAAAVAAGPHFEEPKARVLTTPSQRQSRRPGTAASRPSLTGPQISYGRATAIVDTGTNPSLPAGILTQTFASMPVLPSSLNVIRGLLP